MKKILLVAAIAALTACGGSGGSSSSDGGQNAGGGNGGAGGGNGGGNGGSGGDGNGGSGGGNGGGNGGGHVALGPDRHFFLATDSSNDEALYITDGSSAGTQKLLSARTGSNLNGGTAGKETVTQPVKFADNRWAFLAQNQQGKRELYISDGSAAGTQAISAKIDTTEFDGIDLTISELQPDQLVTMAGTLYFSGTLPSLGGAPATAILWQSDGTATGTKPFFVFESGQWPQDITAVGDTLYYTAIDACCRQLFTWRKGDDRPYTDSDVLLAADQSGGTLYDFTAFNNSVYASGFNPNHGRELWRIDLDYNSADSHSGYNQILTQVKNIGESSIINDSADNYRNGNPRELVAGSNHLFFRTQASGYQYELWSTQGTAETTVRIGPANYSAGRINLLDDGIAFQQASEVRIAKPTSANATEFNISDVKNSAEASGLIRLGDKLIFSGLTREPHVIDLKNPDTAAELKAIETGDAEGSHPRDFVKVNDRVIFLANTRSELTDQIWVTDGSGDNTQKLGSYPIGQNLTVNVQLNLPQRMVPRQPL